jgi:sporulation protein YlmC with PRC-barrel domain
MTMTETMQFTIGADASCSDGICGEVTRVVVDPVAQAVTHLVVEPKHRQGLGRLVPLDLIETTNGEIQIRCTEAEFEKLDAAEETEFLPGGNGYGSYGGGQVLYQPYYGLGMGGMGLGGMGMGGMGLGNMSQPVTYDTVPLGEVAVRRGEHVHATDGDIGKVQGLVIDPRNHHVTHVLLHEGHLWGKKEVAIPISAVVGVEDGIRLNIAKDDVQELPSVDIDNPTG